MIRQLGTAKVVAAASGVFTGLAAGILLSGCGAKPPEPPVTSTPSTETAPAAKTTEITKPGETPKTAPLNYSMSFAEAVRDDLGEDQLLPPDRTIAGKSTAPLREAVEKLWASIPLVDQSGKPLKYVVTLDTEEGPVEITVSPDLAPNHVRNFLALVKVGYYDGLKFDRIIHQETEQAGKKYSLDMLKAGCPAGTGDPGIGHIGYHLKPEFHETVKHEEGTVGFSREVDPATAGVRFYITLGTAPALDGNFSLIGKVSKGMDTLKKIAAGKLLPPDVDPAREFPEKPVTIKKAIAIPDPTATVGSVAQSGR